MNADDFRRIALGMQGAIERAHMGHPDFRANGRVFASLHASGQSGTLKLAPEEQQELIRQHQKVFTPAPGAWGRQGWTAVGLAGADESTVRGAVILAWDAVRTRPSRRQSARVASAAHAAWPEGKRRR